jgi:hypothetical protein
MNDKLAKRVAIALLSLLTVAGCGASSSSTLSSTGTSFSLEEAGSCPPGVEYEPFPMEFATSLFTWVEVPSLTITNKSEYDLTVVSFAPSAVLRQGMSSSSDTQAVQARTGTSISGIMSPADVAAARAALQEASHRSFILGLAPSRDAVHVGEVIDIGADGTATFLSTCGRDRGTGPLASLAASKSNPLGVSSAADLLRAVIRDPSIAGPKSSTTTPPDWAAQSPDRRQVNPQDTPTSIMSTLRPVIVSVTIPSDWSAADPTGEYHWETLCVRSSYAWGSCARLGPGAPGPVSLVAYLPPTGDQTTLSLYLTDNAEFDNAQLIGNLQDAGGFAKAQAAVTLSGDLKARSVAMSSPGGG